MQQIKCYSFFTDRAHYASLYALVRFFSIWKFIPFTILRSFIHFAHSLTLFVKDTPTFPFLTDTKLYVHAVYKRQVK